MGVPRTGNQLSAVHIGATILLLVGFTFSLIEASEPDMEVIAAGERLVDVLDCNVCHTPKVFTNHGPELDSSRLLSGHPAGEKLAPIPSGLIGQAGWGGLFDNNLTAWAGQWGVSFGTNLTPETETGIGNWTEDVFVEALRTGVHVEEGRPFLPPMPTYARLTDAELHAIFVYLQSIEPVKNDVPDAVLGIQPSDE